MSTVVELSARKPIDAASLTPQVVHDVLTAAEMNAELIEQQNENFVVVHGDAFDVFISVAHEDVQKIYYSARVRFRPRLSLRARLAAANRINSRIIGAVWVDGGLLKVGNTISFAGGILAHNIVNTIRDFQILVECEFDSEEMLELLE